ncbi:MAG: ABC transporter permease [Thermacetogeniaceae bacterium]|nr:ABC transporter permease [Syntrophomonadaceae bacterium]
MNRFFYAKLAVNNIKKNAQTYIPYLLTGIGTIMMFYNMSFLAIAKDIGSLSDSAQLRSLLSFGAGVIAVFSVIFLFYTNSFLTKRRKKEFGLFNILGMEKKHIARIIFWETLFTAVISLGVGLAAGILFSKLMILLLFKIITFKVTFGFEIPIVAVINTCVLFGGIFLLNLIYNVFQVHLSKPIELLKGSSVGEKEPKTNWLIAIIGAVSLAIAYYIALTTESPLAALFLFFVAVILVMIGTYCLFTAGSIALLKMLRKNKSYYYQLKHFIPVSGMIYRMKQNAAGLANICILSTAVIIMLSTTVSMYVGMEDLLRTRYPRNILVSARNVSDEQANKLDAAIEKHTLEAGLIPKDVIRYRSMSFAVSQDGANFTSDHSNNFAAGNIAMVVCLTADEYNRMENKSVSLDRSEALLYTLQGDIPGDTVNFNGFELSVKDRLASLETEDKMSALLTNSYFLIVADVDTIKQIYNSLSVNQGDMGELSYYYGFDVAADKEAQISLVSALQKALKEINADCYVEGAESARAGFYSIYGGLFFLGIFLGLLFIMATVLIIYYKQIAEGYDDRERFEIMQKVGMSRDEVKQAIKSQVLAVFFLPLVAAVIHIGFAFKVITKMLAVLNLTNVQLFAGCTALTILVFAVFYVIIYGLTARTYYHIVS